MGRRESPKCSTHKMMPERGKKEVQTFFLSTKRKKKSFHKLFEEWTRHVIAQPRNLGYVVLGHWAHFLKRPGGDHKGRVYQGSY